MIFVTCPSPDTKELWALRKEHLTVCVPVPEILGSGGLSFITKPEEEEKITQNYLAKKTLNFVSFYYGALCK